LELASHFDDDRSDHDHDPLRRRKKRRQDIYDCPPPNIIDAEEVYEIQEILDTQVRKRGRYEYQQFLVSWKGYPSEDNTWEDEGNLEDAADAVADFKKRHPTWSRRFDAAGDVGYEEGTM
jgi:Chromo (CHRromatin Organisation MOdifier) domain